VEINRKDIEKIIELETENKFLNHLWNIFIRDYRPKGKIENQEIIIWRQSIWNAVFYPIFTFELNSKNYLIKISEKLNPVGKAILGIVISCFIYFVIIKNIVDNNFINNWILILFICVFASIVSLTVRMIYKSEKRNQLNELYEILDIEVTGEKTENESSLKKTLARLLIYPFCLFLIGLSIFILIPGKNYLFSVIIFFLVGFYLFTDLKILLRK
jgi:hypothetical protein